MAPRVSSPYWLRAEGVVTPWATILRRRIAEAGRSTQLDPRLVEGQRAAVERRGAALQLRWACARALGVPPAPFRVWVRRRAAKLEQVTPTVVRGRTTWGFVSATVQVTCTVADGTKPVALYLLRSGRTLREAVAAAAVRGAAGTQVTLVARCGGATRAVLVNGRDPAFQADRLDDVINDQAWREFEIVGLPADDPWAGTAYQAGKQGMVSALTDPVTAALQRLDRGGAPIGWYPLTEGGRVAPAWAPPDHAKLVGEVRGDLLPHVARLYRPGLLNTQQGALVDAAPVEGPRSASRTSSLAARAELPPLALLTLPASSEPFLALATGFGTAYLPEQLKGFDVPGAVGGMVPDFLVTADYPALPDGSGPATVAAFVPGGVDHGVMAPPTSLTAERAGLVSPEVRDGPWRETVRVSWDRLPVTVALGRASGAVVARYDVPGSGQAVCLQEVRAAGDRRPLIPVPDGAEGTPGHARSAMVDAAAVIPIGSGGRRCGYAVAVQDVFGVWSRWEDVGYAGTEPAPPRPRVLALRLDTQYAGGTNVPATLQADLSVDWADRRPTRLDVQVVFYRMAAASDPPPAGAVVVGPPPSGGFRRDVALPFAGDALTGPGDVTIEHLGEVVDPTATHDVVVAPGAAQGAQGRRYRVRIPVTLDFGATRWWGVRVWVRGALAVGPSPSDWSPDPARPATATAASPVPALPLAPPPVPGVPVGSTPDAEGCSHARVSWSLPSGADVRTVVLWEVSETALRRAAGDPARAPEVSSPGQRLLALQDAWSRLTPAKQRSVFRRVRDLAGTAREADVTLPRGSTDIHLFTVTTVTSTGIEWPPPEQPVPAAHLRPVAAPRLRRPSAPRLRTTIGAGGAVTCRLEAPSRVPVREFRLYRTRSAAAARSFETMGPAFAIVPAALPASAVADPVTGELAYTGTWSGAFEASWDEWFVRAVAVPEDLVPVQAVRGLLSPACEPVTVTVLPELAPDLAPLTADVWGAAHDGVMVRTSTSVPVREVALGSHRLSGRAGAVNVPVVAVEAVAPGEVVNLAAPPAGAAAAPVLVRGPRAGGRTPLALWFRRPVAADPVDVVLRLADPLGRVTEQRITVPGWTPPAPPAPTLVLVDVMTIAGRGTVLRLRSDASPTAAPPYVLEVVAAPTGITWLRPPGRPPIPMRPPAQRASFPLPAIPRTATPFPAGPVIQAVRTTAAPPHEYQLLIRVAPPFTATVAMVAPNGARTTVSREVR